MKRILRLKSGKSTYTHYPDYLFDPDQNYVVYLQDLIGSAKVASTLGSLIK